MRSQGPVRRRTPPRGLMFCGHHFGILDNLLPGGSHFHTLGPANHTRHARGWRLCQGWTLTELWLTEQAGASPHLHAGQSPKTRTQMEAFIEVRCGEGPPEGLAGDTAEQHPRAHRTVPMSSPASDDRPGWPGWGGEERGQLSAGPWPLQGIHQPTPPKP